MIVKNPINLIGDALGTFPVLQQMNKDYENFSVIVDNEIRHLYDLVPEIKICECSHYDKELNLSGAFTISHQQGLYMTQAHYPFMGYPMPGDAVKANLTIPKIQVPVYDYIFAPFGRSAPDEQKWSIENWIELIEMMSDKKIAVFGNSKYDNPFPNDIPNITNEFDRPMTEVCNLMLNVKQGVVSIVTGISHLAFHLDVKNYLLCNQGMTWGLNPDSIKITNHIPSLTPKELYDILLKA